MRLLPTALPPTGQRRDRRSTGLHAECLTLLVRTGKRSIRGGDATVGNHGDRATQAALFASCAGSYAVTVGGTPSARLYAVFLQARYPGSP